MQQRAALRPVPHRPTGPVDLAEALRHVEQHVPSLDAEAARALALVEIAGQTRSQLRAETGIDADELSEALARARKALRRAAFPLPGSGWCERAERLLSDELDGELPDPGPRRLAAHLANCERCTEHERRLWQARDRLIASFDPGRGASVVPTQPPADEPDEEAPGMPEPELKLIELPQRETPFPPPPEPEPDEPPAEPPPAAARSLTAVAWTALMAVTILLAILSIALTVYGIAGGGF